MVNVSMRFVRLFFQESTRQQLLITAHELVGHGLLDGLSHASQEMYAKVENAWKVLFESYPNILEKDKNSRSPLHGEGNGIGDLTIQQEEFIADRMAEWYTRTLGEEYDGVTFLRDKEDPFTSEEEILISKLCKESLDYYKLTVKGLTKTA